LANSSANSVTTASTNIQSEADKTVYFTAAQWDADLIIYKTDIPSDAGWVNSAKSGLL